MKNIINDKLVVLSVLLVVLLFLNACDEKKQGSFISSEKLGYHNIVFDKDSAILPWYSPINGVAYDHILDLVWNFWDTMRVDMNGIPYYMNHQVWNPDFNDPRGLGGDQINMALSSWQLLYNYSGNEKVKENMRFMASYWLSHGMTPSNYKWPNVPFPYNISIYSGYYDGDMVLGKDYIQPDKAGSFGYELVKLYKMEHKSHWPSVIMKYYLNAAIQIAHTLALNTQLGDSINSPLPFKVNALTGEVGRLKLNDGSHRDAAYSSYTSNWSATLCLFEDLIKLGVGDTILYAEAHKKIFNWMKEYPMYNNKWGPFFEDIPGWSDTQINAVTFARYIMEHKDHFPDWQKDVSRIFDWVYKNLADKRWNQFKVTPIHEQTAYTVPGNSHTSRQAAAELMFVSLSGDSSRYQGAIRQLNWATYMVDTDGKNCYPFDENWLTDGYGDYVRHYLNAMAVAPELASPYENHIIYSSSVLCHVEYAPKLNKFLVPVVHEPYLKNAMLYYRTYDAHGIQRIRMKEKPALIVFDGQEVRENSDGGCQWKWMAMPHQGGCLYIEHQNAKEIIIVK